MQNQITQFNSMCNIKVNKMLLLLTSLAMLTGCSGGDEKPKAIGQSIVSVNGEEITVHQVNAQLQTKKINPKQKDVATKKIVQNLIDREILVQAAQDEGLDRNPQVMSAIHENKRQILAQAYMQSKVSKIASPTEKEIATFRSENANVFANRKLYAMEEISFNIPSALVADLETLSNTAKTLEGVSSWLDSKSIQYKQTKAVHAAEKLPKKLLDKMSTMRKGELVFVNGPGKIVVGKLLDTRDQPISEKDSKSLIKRALINQKQEAAASAELKRLKGAAEIVYLDKAYQSPSPIVSSGVSDVAKSDSNEKVKDSGTEASQMAEHVEKGLSGL